MENYRILRKIGSGNFAKVYLALHLPTQEQVALKIIDKTTLDSPKMKVRVEREISNMRRLRHCGVVEYFESFETREEHVVVMEYLPCGELFEHVWRHGGLSEDSARKIFVQIVEAVNYCHKNSVIHRDLKLENILLDKNYNPKLIDFGFSKDERLDEMTATYCGSPLYASPEMVMGKPYLGPECDVWSLGVILYCMLTACMPFDDRDLVKFINALEKGAYMEPQRASDSVRNLISRMLDPNPETRATVLDILLHPWVQMSKLHRNSVHSGNTTSHRQRKMNIIYSKSEAEKLAQSFLNSCQIEDSTHHHHHGDCSCNNISPSKEHCCVKNLPYRKCVVKDVSCASSGYGSQSGSSLFTPPPTTAQTTFSFQSNKSNLTSSSAFRGCSKLQNTSQTLPRNTYSSHHHQAFRESIADEDEELVFV